MIEIFYKKDGQMMVSQSETDFATIPYENVIWIDLYSPSGDEKRATEHFLGTTIQNRAQAEEIEISSRFSETEKAIFANTSFLIPGPEEYNEETVSFILTDNILTTLRECPLRSFTDLQRRLLAFPTLYSSGHVAFLSILEQRIDLDADMVEIVSKEITQYTKRSAWEKTSARSSSSTSTRCRTTQCSSERTSSTSSELSQAFSRAPNIRKNTRQS